MPQASEHRMSRARDPSVITSQPKATNKLLNGHRAPSQEHRPCCSSSAIANGLSTTSKLRPLPPRPSPLDDRGKKLESDRGRPSKRSEALRGAAARRGPVKADHALKVPGCPQASGTISGSTSFTMPPGVLLGGPDSDRRRSNLLRSKSISIGDLSQAGVPREEQLSAAFSRLALRDHSPSCGHHKLGLGAALALKRSSSLRRVNVAAGLDGRPSATLLSVRTEGCPRTRPTEPPTLDYMRSQDLPLSTSPPQSKSPGSGRLEEKAATVRDRLGSGGERRKSREGHHSQPRAPQTFLDCKSHEILASTASGESFREFVTWDKESFSPPDPGLGLLLTPSSMPQSKGAWEL